MIDRHLQLASLLMDVEKELHDLMLWQAHPPSPAELASTQPFALDTLTFPQWLQFIFLPRLTLLVETRSPLPTQCSVAPMAEEYFKVLPLNGDMLVALLRVIDKLLSEPGAG